MWYPDGAQSLPRHADHQSALALIRDDLFAESALFFQSLQDEIISTVEAFDTSAKFVRDDWSRPPVDWSVDGPALDGGGRTRVLEGGDIIERGGVNFSMVWGRFTPAFAAQLPVGSELAFAACGVSVVLHPRSPHGPTVHMNYRRLSRSGAGWFGGGADLTPYYLREELARHFHQVHADACDRHPEVADYAEFKRACDAYFHNPHRGEGRGVGGVFFDYLTSRPTETLAFVKDIGRCFLPAYMPSLEASVGEPWGEPERSWQEHRRGRYVEFNLIHDRGTTFGLKTGGRTESILMSLPPRVRWSYQHHPTPGSREAELLDVLKNPRDWVSRPQA